MVLSELAIRRFHSHSHIQHSGQGRSPIAFDPSQVSEPLRTAGEGRQNKPPLARKAGQPPGLSPSRTARFVLTSGPCPTHCPITAALRNTARPPPWPTHHCPTIGHPQLTASRAQHGSEKCPNSGAPVSPRAPKSTPATADSTWPGALLFPNSTSQDACLSRFNPRPSLKNQAELSPCGKLNQVMHPLAVSYNGTISCTCGPEPGACVLRTRRKWGKPWTPRTRINQAVFAEIV